MLNEKNALNQKQNIFRINNNNNLVKYQEDEKKNEDHPHNLNYEKVEFIRKWATSNSINTSKELPFEEIDELNNKINKIYTDKLNKLKMEKNAILQLLFPQLIKSLFDSFNLLTEIKTITLKERNNEIDKYTSLLIEANEKEKELKIADEAIAKLNKTIQKEKKNYEEKIASLTKKINELTIEASNLKKEHEECKTQKENT